LSRIGKKPIRIPEGIEVTIKDNVVSVKGPKGVLDQELHPSITVKNENNTLSLTRANDDKFQRSLHGLYRSLLFNNIVGVSQGFQKRLRIIGTGYKAEVKGKELVLNLGYSHQIQYPIPDDIEIHTENPTLIVIGGISKERVGLIAAKIRSFRPPEPYQGKGIRYEDERVRRKAGKTGI
jgi:large subunit ribosomal protein L6